MIYDAGYQPCEHEAIEMDSDQFMNQIIKLWEGLATELTSIIGHGGFRTLFARSVTLANVKFPWLEDFRFPLQGESPFFHFKACLAGRDIAEMREANALIVSAFIETLSSLVGKTLTNNILRPAWEQRRPPNSDDAGRQPKRNMESISK